VIPHIHKSLINKTAKEWSRVGQPSAREPAVFSPVPAWLQSLQFTVCLYLAVLISVSLSFMSVIVMDLW
jgi:hypothetical protein